MITVLTTFRVRCDMCSDVVDIASETTGTLSLEMYKRGWSSAKAFEALPTDGYIPETVRCPRCTGFKKAQDAL